MALPGSPKIKKGCQTVYEKMYKQQPNGILSSYSRFHNQISFTYFNIFLVSFYLGKQFRSITRQGLDRTLHYWADSEWSKQQACEVLTDISSWQKAAPPIWGGGKQWRWIWYRKWYRTLQEIVQDLKGNEGIFFYSGTL